MVRKDFAILILSHGRPDNVKCVSTLKKVGYTGNWYIIIDNEDDSADRYYELFGDKVIMFNKQKLDGTFDIMDNFDGRSVPVFARNVLYDIAKQLNLKYFLELEDDTLGFVHRYVEDDKLKVVNIYDFDSIINSMIEYLSIPIIDTVAFIQAGDLLGGHERKLWQSKVVRKAMQTFFFKVDNPVYFQGRFNDDVNMYLQYGKLGKVVLSIRDVVLITEETQKVSGGITEMYQKYGTYVKSFYSVMLRPDCVKIHGMTGFSGNRRLHHRIDWETAVPKIISGRFKK